MPIKNIKDLLTQATNLPTAIEARLPEGAPKVSTMLTDATNSMPAVPDFPVELPDLPAVPEIPELPGTPSLGRRYVTEVEVKPVAAPSPAAPPAPARRTVTPLVQEYTQPIEGVVGQVTTRRGM